jgi:hypothetical protein
MGGEGADGVRQCVHNGICSARPQSISIKGGVDSINGSHRIVVLGLAIAGLFGSRMFAQDADRKDRPQNETTMTGCLNKGTVAITR